MSGPVPTRLLSATRAEVLRRVVAGGDAGLTLSEIHGSDSRHPNATRQILGALVEDGLIVSAPRQPSGRGRPPLAWAATAKGRGALAAGNESSTVVGVLASYVVASSDGPSAHEVGLRWSAAHADTIDRSAPGIDGLVEVLAALGFDPVRRQGESGDSLLLRSCPLLGAARDHREVVCEMHRGMLDGVVHRIGERQGVTLLPFAEEQGCCVEVEPAR